MAGRRAPGPCPWQLGQLLAAMKAVVDRLQGEQDDQRPPGGQRGQRQVTGSDRYSDGGYRPESRRGRQATNAASVAKNRSSSEETHPGDDLSGDASVAEDRPDDGEQRRSEPHQHVGT